ncbi:hypothetical protein F5B22DRAFT_584566 [Xylaria bambusicola]|uniref:uncharacterized protein n=1 Tax=Xylaria bambusicola TaxID=326684 RepID=UPI002008CC2A|nr:uncharacterized protein F5B22DRAFT_584566 [Xylaria bambusicola]KAI0528310.1 hypothetical protein F5B22DRAFT_584566 [Xylaria bambusicola]
MQFKTIALSLFVAVVAAESVDQLVKQIPSCATTCLNDAAKKAGCAVDDYKCQCDKILDITTDAIPCVSGACSGDDLTKTSQVTTQLCLAVAQQVGDDTYSSAIESLTSSIGSATRTANPSEATESGSAGSATTDASPAPTGAANQAVAAMGVVGAAAMLALAL